MNSLMSLKTLPFKVYILSDKICHILTKSITIAKREISFTLCPNG